MKNMKNIFMHIAEAVIFVEERLAKKPKLVTFICAIVWTTHLILNNMYYNKAVPITGIILRPWMAYLNVIFMGIISGFTVGYVNRKNR